LQWASPIPLPVLGSLFIDMEGPRVELFCDLNDFGLGDEIGTRLAAIPNFKIFKVSAANRSILYTRVERRGRHKVLTLSTIA